MDFAVSPKTTRRRGVTKEHIPQGSVTEEQRSRRAVFGETLRAEALLSWFFVARRSQIPEGYARSSLREPDQNISQQQCPWFFNGLLRHG